MSGMIADQNYSVLIYPGATKRFIFNVALERIEVKVVKKYELKYVEISLGGK